MIDKTRFRPINIKKSPIEKSISGPVLYLMARDQRVLDNWALLFAQELALESKQPLIVSFCLVRGFQNAQKRHYNFMFQGLAEVSQKLKSLNIPFFFLQSRNREEAFYSLAKKISPSVVVCDFSPLRGGRRWRNKLAEKLSCLMYEVDAHNIVPCWVASEKQEYSARFFRPKIHKNLERFLVSCPNLIKHPYQIDSQTEKEVKTGVDESILYSSSSILLQSGEDSAKKKLDYFIKNGLKRYNLERIDPTKNAISGLSPYLHFGQISAQTIALKIMRSKAEKDSKESFLEELIVRKELSDNYCFYNQNYDNFLGFSEWAQKTLRDHENDSREYTYNLRELESAETHDKLWNAAQKEMVKLGFMHGYMRMYWAKKILEWSANPQEAQETAIYLNDKYELDGRDPNGYTGIAWSIGGVHDRAWAERPVFGKIRYMSYVGCQRKFAVEEYINIVESL